MSCCASHYDQGRYLNDNAMNIIYSNIVISQEVANYYQYLANFIDNLAKLTYNFA